MLPAGRPGGGAVLIALPAVLHSPALLLPLVGRGADVAAISTRAFARQGLQVHPLGAEPPLTAC